MQAIACSDCCKGATHPTLPCSKGHAVKQQPPTPIGPSHNSEYSLLVPDCFHTHICWTCDVCPIGRSAMICLPCLPCCYPRLLVQKLPPHLQANSCTHRCGTPAPKQSLQSVDDACPATCGCAQNHQVLHDAPYCQLIMLQLLKTINTKHA